MHTNSQPTVAEIIAQQLGGLGRLKSFVNGREFAQDENLFQFRFSGSRQMNKVVIRLNSMDTYDVEFWKIGRFSMKTLGIPMKKVKTVNNVYCDQLISTFENTTELYLHM